MNNGGQSGTHILVNLPAGPIFCPVDGYRIAKWYDGQLKTKCKGTCGKEYFFYVDTAVIKEED